MTGTETLLAQYKRIFGGSSKLFINEEKQEARLELHVGGKEIICTAQPREFKAMKENAESLGTDIQTYFETKLLRRAYGRYVLLLIDLLETEDLTYKAGFDGYDIYYKEKLFCHADVEQEEDGDFGKIIVENAELAEARIKSLKLFPSAEDLAVMHGIFK